MVEKRKRPSAEYLGENEDKVCKVKVEMPNGTVVIITSPASGQGVHFEVGSCRVEGDKASPEVFPNSARVPMSRPGFGTKGSTIPMWFRGNGRMLCPSGVSSDSVLIQIKGRVLSPPQKLVLPRKIEHWAIVNFSVSCDVQELSKDLIRYGKQHGILFKDPYVVIKENPSVRTESPLDRVENMLEQIRGKRPFTPQFLLCLLPESDSAIYGLWAHLSVDYKESLTFKRKLQLISSQTEGPWKRKTRSEFGIVTQCMAPQHFYVDLGHLTNVLLNINMKLGGSKIFIDLEHSIPLISKASTLFLGMSVSHRSPESDVPSIAAVVSSRHWPLISCYRASMRTQSPKVEIIDSLFKQVSDNIDEGIVRELLLDFSANSGGRMPEQIVIFRDGVGESQFHQVLNFELDQIKEACKFLDEKWHPRFTVITAQQCQPTKFQQLGTKLQQLGSLDDDDNDDDGGDDDGDGDGDDDVDENEDEDEDEDGDGDEVEEEDDDEDGDDDDDDDDDEDDDEDGDRFNTNVTYHGTILTDDRRICYPQNYDFYIYSDARMTRDSPSTHYHVLFDEIGFSADELQELVHSLCYAFEPSTASTPIVAPIFYARQAASQTLLTINLDGVTVSELPSLHSDVRVRCRKL